MATQGPGTYTVTDFDDLTGTSCPWIEICHMEWGWGTARMDQLAVWYGGSAAMEIRPGTIQLHAESMPSEGRHA